MRYFFKAPIAFLFFSLFALGTQTSDAEQIDKKGLCDYAYQMSLIEANWAKKVQENISPSDNDAAKNSKWESYQKYSQRAANWSLFYKNICM